MRQQRKRFFIAAPAYLTLFFSRYFVSEFDQVVLNSHRLVARLKIKRPDWTNRLAGDARLFLQLAASSDFHRLPWFDVSLGKDPILRRLLRADAEDQDRFINDLECDSTGLNNPRHLYSSHATNDGCPRSRDSGATARRDLPASTRRTWPATGAGSTTRTRPA